MTSDLDEETAIDALHQGPREAFVERRNALAQRLHAQGRSSAAERVRGLPKPSVSAWTVNQLWWRHREAYDALHAAGAELLRAQQDGASLAGQPANDARRAAIDRLRALAVDILGEAGHRVSPATVRKISQSLEASAAGGSFGTTPVGRLQTDLSSPGFGQLARFCAPLEPGSGRGRTEAAAESEAASRARARTAAQLADAASVLSAAQASVADAQAALARAGRTHAEAQESLERARTRHEAARLADDAAQRRLEAAQG